MACISKLAAIAFVTVLLAGCAALSTPPAQAPGPLEALKAQTPAVLKTEPQVSRESQQQYERALVALSAGRHADAERELAALTAREPKLAGPHANLGILYHRMGRAAQAITALERAIDLNPERAPYHNMLGMVHRGEGRFAQARAAYERALALDPNYAYAHLNLGILYDLYLAEPQKALPHYEHYRTLAPQEAGAVAKWIADIKQRGRTGTARQTKGDKNG